MSAIRRPMVVLIFLMATVAVAMIAGVYIYQSYQLHDRLTYPYGQTEKEKADALRIAINDPSVYEGVMDKGGKYSVDFITNGSFSNSGFINASGKFTLVNVQAGDGPPMPMWFQVLADVSNNREMEARYTYDVMPMPSRVLIPAGSCWYRSIKYASGVPYASISLSLEPDNATVYPMVMNGTNFERFMGDGSFNALRYMEYSTNEMVVYDGRRPVISGWSANMSLNSNTSGLSGDGMVYVVLKNIGSDNVIARFNVFPPGH